MAPTKKKRRGPLEWEWFNCETILSSPPLSLLSFQLCSPLSFSAGRYTNLIFLFHEDPSILYPDGQPNLDDPVVAKRPFLDRRGQQVPSCVLDLDISVHSMPRDVQWFHKLYLRAEVGGYIIFDLALCSLVIAWRNRIFKKKNMYTFDDFESHLLTVSFVLRRAWRSRYFPTRWNVCKLDYEKILSREVWRRRLSVSISIYSYVASKVRFQIYRKFLSFKFCWRLRERHVALPI